MKGSVSYVDWPHLLHDHMAPIQLALDGPYDENGHCVIRTHLDDLVKLKPKKQEDKPYLTEIRRFQQWLKNL